MRILKSYLRIRFRLGGSDLSTKRISVSGLEFLFIHIPHNPDRNRRRETTNNTDDWIPVTELYECDRNRHAPACNCEAFADGRPVRFRNAELVKDTGQQPARRWTRKERREHKSKTETARKE